MPQGPSGPSSDRWRWVVVAACLLGILALAGAYTHWAMTLPDGIRACQAEPAAHDGTRLVFPVWFVAGVDGPDRYRVSRVVKDVVVEGDTTGLERGQTITLVGHFRGADAVVVEERREIHRWREHKKRLSLLALALAVVGAPLGFRWRGGFLELRAPAADAPEGPDA